MITRIVKMIFRPEEVHNFLEVFETNKALIAGSAGCTSLQLLRQKDEQHVYFTISVWESESFLNRYRESELFAEVWGKTKKMFAGKPEAWTLVSAE
jgi:heme-degrading monooxygenase HmoA